MKRRYAIRRMGGFLCCFLCLLLWSQVAWAADADPNWRHTYDLAMRWFNFLVLALIIYKYGKTPFINFIQGRKDSFAKEIGQVESQKQEIDQTIQQTFSAIEDGSRKLEQIKERIVRQGQRKKEELLASAKQQSRLMLEEAKNRVKHQISQAKEALRAELIDSAAAMAVDRLPAEITDADDQKFIADFMVDSAK